MCCTLVVVISDIRAQMFTSVDGISSVEELRDSSRSFLRRKKCTKLYLSTFLGQCFGNRFVNFHEN